MDPFPEKSIFKTLLSVKWRMEVSFLLKLSMWFQIKYVERQKKKTKISSSTLTDF